MVLNRRAFLRRFGIGVAAAYALAQMPVGAVGGMSVPEAGKRSASEDLRRVYFDWCRAHPGCLPREMHAGAELYQAYEGELLVCRHFCAAGQDGEPHLLFKGLRLFSVGRGWTARVA